MNRSTACAAALLSLGLFACSSAQQQRPSTSAEARSAGQPGGRASGEEATPSAPERAADAPDDVAISDLVPDPGRVVRIKGVLSAVVGMRLVPPQRIFQVTDRTGAVKVVIYEEVQLKEGTRLELVGRYKAIPSPMHTGPDEAPPENIFVVERYLDLP